MAKTFKQVQIEADQKMRNAADRESGVDRKRASMNAAVAAMTHQSPFYRWLCSFIEEKGIDMSEPVAGHEGRELQVGDVMTAIASTTPQEQSKIKSTLIEIDFKNGNVMHYIKHLAKAPGVEKVGI